MIKPMYVSQSVEKHSEITVYMSNLWSALNALNGHSGQELRDIRRTMSSG